MFWKFVVGFLVLPSCLGFEIAAASMPSANLAAPVEQIHKDKNSRDYASIPGDVATDSGTLLQTKYHYDYKISHRYYRYKDCDRDRYYSQSGYHPQYVDYYRGGYGNRYHHHRYNKYYRGDRYHNGYHHPRYTNYYRGDRYHNGYHHPRSHDYYQRDRYGNGYHHHNGYYR